jgi:hypothetical protein
LSIPAISFLVSPQVSRPSSAPWDISLCYSRARGGSQQSLGPDVHPPLSPYLKESPGRSGAEHSQVRAEGMALHLGPAPLDGVPETSPHFIGPFSRFHPPPGVTDYPLCIYTGVLFVCCQFVSSSLPACLSYFCFLEHMFSSYPGFDHSFCTLRHGPGLQTSACPDPEPVVL